MRWKLLIAATLAATLVGAGGCLAVAHFLLGSTRAIASPGLVASAAFLIPLAAIGYASVFVYRHTARRRTLQAVAAALLASLLTLAALLAGTILLARPTPAPELLNVPANKT